MPHRSSTDGRAARIRVVLVHDHPIVLHGLEELFEGEQDFQVLF